MILELLVAFFFALLLGLALWALFGLVLMPVFGAGTVTLMFAEGDGTGLEQKTRAFGWLRENRKDGGTLLIVDCGLTAEGLELAQKLRQSRPWMEICPNRVLTDHIELLQHCLEKKGRM